MNFPISQPLYRSRDGIILGVIQGLADHFQFSVFWLRLLALILFLFSGLWPMTGIYLLAGVLMKPAPATPLQTEEENEFYQNYLIAPRTAADRLSRRFENLELRVRRIEDIVTSKEFDFERRLAEPPAPQQTNRI